MKKYVNTLIFSGEYSIPMKQETVFDKLSSSGFNEVEIRREYIGDKESEIPVIAESAKQASIILYYAIVDTYYKNEKLDRDSIDLYFKEAAALGAVTVKLMPGDFVSLSDTDAEYLRLKTEYGIKLLLENGRKSSPEQMKNLISACEDEGIEMGITFDLGNWVWGGCNVPEVAEMLKPWTKAVHLKDGAEVNGEFKVVPVGEGVTDWKRVVDILSDCRFAIEYDCGVPAIENMIKELDKLKK